MLSRVGRDVYAYKFHTRSHSLEGYRILMLDALADIPKTSLRPTLPPRFFLFPLPFFLAFFLSPLKTPS